MTKFFSFAVAAVVLAGLAFTPPAEGQFINIWGQPSDRYGRSVMPPSYYASLNPSGYYGFNPYASTYAYYGPTYGPYYFGTAGPYYGGPAANYYYYSYWNRPYVSPYPYASYYTPTYYYGGY